MHNEKKRKQEKALNVPISSTTSPIYIAEFLQQISARQPSSPVYFQFRFQQRQVSPSLFTT